MDKKNDDIFLVALSSFSFFGPARVMLLVRYFGSAKKAWEASQDDLIEVGIREASAREFIAYRSRFDISSYLKRLANLKINYTTYRDSDYPENLREISDFPPVLYFIGSLKKVDKNAIAIVGSRKMSAYGRDVARTISAELAVGGVTIVSGLALGIDAVAHKACCDAGGRSIAVLASGLDIISPASNRHIALELAKNGAIVSEYPLGYRPTKISFPSRNRIISGLSKAVVVVEGLRKSGTLLTASSAAEQGRTVFAVPGPITSPLTQAPHYLIQNGAKLVSKTEDILEELDISLRINRDELEKVLPSSEFEELVLKSLTDGTLHIDEIARITGLNPNKLSATLTVMELKGIVRNIGGSVYKKV
jgi:DNA processing protein